MGPNIRAARSRATWRLAQAQHGVLTRADLLRLGFSDDGIKHRVGSATAPDRGRGLCRGTSRVVDPRTVDGCCPRVRQRRRTEPSERGRALGIGYEEPGRIDVTIRRRSTLERTGIKVRSRPKLLERSVVRRIGIPVTHPVQTLIDLATELKPLRLERAVNQADVHDLVDPETLRTALDGYGGVPGVKTLRTMLDRHTFRLSDSDLEILFRPLARAAAFPSPLSKHWVLGYEVDFWFPDLGLVVETDGLRYHRTPAQQARMVKRDQTHTAAGLRVLRFTHWQIAYAPTEVTEVLRKVRPHLSAA